MGFKSFAKKTKIIFKGGITGIVGPNGCGKSNVVDAIRWVMGEQRSGVLRSERMENVIFNGSASSKPVGMAEVSLKIENTRNILPVEYSEVVITRRLFRSGESQYFINGNQCRLKDIVDLFMDTGLGPGTYSVIELPQVEKILNGKEDERRRIFEEAAGITKYKLRRKATFRKLEATEKDLIRVEDIMSEVEKSVRSLQRQVAKAKRYQNYSSELKEIEIKLATHEYSKILYELEPLETRLELVRDERESAASILARRDAEYEAARTKLLSLEKDIAEEQKTFNELEKEIQKFEERVLVNKERARALEEARVRYAEEIESFRVRNKERQEELAQAEARKKEAEKELAVKRQEFEKAQKEYEDIRNQYEQKRQQAREVESQILRITEEISRKENEGERLRATGENLSNRLEQLKSEDEQDSERLQSLKQKILQSRATEQKLESEIDEKIDRLDSIDKAIETAHRSLEGLQKANLQDHNRIESLENQAEIIRRLIENFEDYPPGVKYLATSNTESFTSYGPLANLLLVQHHYRTAISSALGEAATHLVVEDTNTALKGIGLLQQEKKGIVSFLPVKQLLLPAPTRPQIQDLGVVGWADDLVRCDEKFKPLVRGLLGSFLVVQDVQTASRLVDAAKKQKINLVTLNGEVIRFWGLVRGGSQGKRQSEFVGRQEQLETLLKEIEKIKVEIDERQQKIVDKEQEVARTKAEAEAVSKEIKELEAQLASLRIELGKLNFEEQSLAEARKKRDQERQRLMSQINDLDQNLKVQSFGTEDLQLKREELAKKSHEIHTELNELEQTVDAFNSQVQSLNVEVARRQSEYEALERECSSILSQIEEVEKLIQARQEETERAGEEIRELEAVNENYNNKVIELKEKLQASQLRLDDLEEQQYKANTLIAEQEKLIRAARSKSEELSESLHQVELRASELRMRLENLQARMMEEFEHTLERKPIDEEFDPEEAHQRIELLRKRLRDMGAVNLLALKEYEQEKERLDFLQTQRDDLMKAKRDLMETIDIINATARKQFLQTFEQIQENFSKVFATFFAGGRASLILREGTDPLEAEIDIYATPGGKRLSSLQLMSGGEKSLTAISLLFAIYLVKPSPFCIFDEVDAPLDDINVQRFTRALREFSDKTQFLVVTHNKLTMRAANQLYGVTMEEEGVSKIVSVKFDSETKEEAAAQQETSKVLQ